MISIEDFEKVEIRVGTVISAEINAKARKPAYVLRIDFGAELGIKTSSAQLVSSYNEKSLVGKKVLAVTNFPARNVAGVVSEVLVLALPTVDERLSLVHPDCENDNVENGARLF
jgi:tRNA-binding protein